MIRTTYATIVVLTLVLLTQNLSAQTDVFFEDFEDSSVIYTTSVADDLSDIAARDYFGRIDSSSGLPADVSYSNQQGNGFYGVQDTDGTPSGNVDIITLDFAGFDITNFTDLEFSFFIGEDTASDGNEDWDIDSSIRVQAQIDGGGFGNIFAVESIDAAVGNMAPAVDTNFDGVGDGAAITDVLTQYTVALADAGFGVGDTLDLRFTIQGLDTGDEDIAIDSVRVSGTAVPEPSSLALLLLVGTATMLRRKRLEV